jgi:HlyD family secretion protein
MGAEIGRLADLSAWNIETSDLTELGVIHVQEDDPVSISVDAIPDAKLSGRVVRVKPLGENKQGDIVYTVLVRPEEQDARLKWNMTTSVAIQAQ